MQILSKRGRVIAEAPDGQSPANFVGCNLSAAHFADKTIERSDFSQCRFSGGSWDGAWMVNCSFDGAEFEGICFDDVTFVSCSFNEALFYDTLHFANHFIECNISARFRGCLIDGALLTNSSLDGAVFGRDNINHKTTIIGTDLSQCDLASASFDQVLYCNGTRFPVKFDPIAHGFIPEPNSGS